MIGTIYLKKNMKKHEKYFSLEQINQYNPEYTIYFFKPERFLKADDIHY